MSEETKSQYESSEYFDVRVGVRRDIHNRGEPEEAIWVALKRKLTIDDLDFEVSRPYHNDTLRRNGFWVTAEPCAGLRDALVQAGLGRYVDTDAPRNVHNVRLIKTESFDFSYHFKGTRNEDQKVARIRKARERCEKLHADSPSDAVKQKLFDDFVAELEHVLSREREVYAQTMTRLLTGETINPEWANEKLKNETIVALDAQLEELSRQVRELHARIDSLSTQRSEARAAAMLEHLEKNNWEGLPEEVIQTVREKLEAGSWGSQGGSLRHLGLRFG